MAVVFSSLPGSPIMATNIVCADPLFFSVCSLVKKSKQKERRGKNEQSKRLLFQTDPTSMQRIVVGAESWLVNYNAALFG